MKMFSTFYPYFIREEECLLALGLYQFAHLKQLPEKRKCYALISQHLLANKMQSQIRLHLKNFRGSSQPVHTLFMVKISILLEDLKIDFEVILI